MAETTGTTMLQTLVDNYNWFIYEFSDPRVKDWLLVPSPVPMLLLTAVYLIIVWRGLHLTVITIYNLFMVALSAYLTKELFITTVWRPGSEYSLVCQIVDYGDDPLTLRILLVMRKENSQITFLHVYHHVGIVIGYWAVGAYGPGGETSFGPMVNSFVNVWIYLILSLSPYFQKCLWWERYISVLQLVQLFVVMLKMGVIIIFDCGLPRVYLVITCIYILIIVLEICRQACNKKEAPKASPKADKTVKKKRRTSTRRSPKWTPSSQGVKKASSNRAYNPTHK